MQALILAAGCGSRMGGADDGVPKGLLEVGGQALLERQVETLTRCGVRRICIVTGYQSERIERRIGGRAVYRYNPFFRHSNNMVSVLFARDWIKEAVVVLYADLLYGADILEPALASRADLGVLTDRSAIAPGHALVAIRDGAVRAIGADLAPEKADGRFVGVSRFSRRGLATFLPALEAAAKAGRIDQYYTVGLAALAARGQAIAAIDVTGRRWREIDTPEDLDAARREWG